MSDAPMAYIRDDGVVVFRASAAGKCSRALWASLAEITPSSVSERLETIFAEGHLHEEAMKNYLDERGTPVKEAQGDVELWIVPGKVVVVGHVDGFVDVGGKRVWENKALARSSFDKWVKHRFDEYEDYAWQISVYMLATECGALYTVKRRDDGLVDEFLIDDPPIPFEQIRKKLLNVYAAFLRADMPKCDPERWGCPYWHLHDEHDGPVVGDEPIALEGPQEKLDEMAAIWMVLTKTEKEIQDRKKKLKAEMDELRQGQRKFETVHHSFDVSERTRETIDKTKLTVDMGREWVEGYTKTTTYDVWTIKERNIEAG